MHTSNTGHDDVRRFFLLINPFNRHIKSHSNGPSYSNTVIDTLAVDGWAVTFGTRRGLGEAAVPVLYQM